jgi:hypothetical protein
VGRWIREAAVVVTHAALPWNLMTCVAGRPERGKAFPFRYGTITASKLVHAMRGEIEMRRNVGRGPGLVEFSDCPQHEGSRTRNRVLACAPAGENSDAHSSNTLLAMA